jgi:hypothetical protein
MACALQSKKGGWDRSLIKWDRMRVMVSVNWAGRVGCVGLAVWEEVSGVRARRGQ